MFCSFCPLALLPSYVYSTSSKRLPMHGVLDDARKHLGPPPPLLQLRVVPRLQRDLRGAGACLPYRLHLDGILQ